MTSPTPPSCAVLGYCNRYKIQVMTISNHQTIADLKQVSNSYSNIKSWVFKAANMIGDRRDRYPSKSNDVDTHIELIPLPSFLDIRSFKSF